MLSLRLKYPLYIIIRVEDAYWKTDMSPTQPKPNTYDMWSASARKAYDAMEARALKAEAELENIERSFTQEIDYLTPVTDTLSWNMIMMRTLNDMLSEVTLTLDPSKMFDKVTQIIGIYLDVTSVYICGWDSTNKAVTVLADYVNTTVHEGDYASDVGYVYSIDKMFEEKLLSSNGHWISHSDEGIEPKSEIFETEKYGVKTFLYYPMYFNERLFGFIEVWDTQRKRDYTPSQLEFVSSVANQIASSVRMAQLHKSLAENEQRYRHLIDTMHGGVVQVDINGTIQYVNHHFARILDMPVEELMNQNFDILWETHAISTDVEDEYRLDHDDGTILYVQVAHTPIMTETQQLLGQVYVYTDVSKRKEAETMSVELILEQERLEQERTHLLAKFIQDISHEFYTPLAIINMKSHLLQRYNKDDRVPSAITSIQNQTRFISDLVKALVLIAYLDSIKNLDLTSYNLKQILQQVIETFAEDVAKNKQKLIFEPVNSELIISCNTEYFIMALGHIIQNALRYTPEEGMIRIYVEETQDSIIIHIEDSGIGMMQEQQSQIFNRFYRVDTARSTQGFGLGLPMVKRIIYLHGGTIHLESELGEGTRISLSLPRLSIN